MKKFTATLMVLVLAFSLCSMAWATGEEVAQVDGTKYDTVQAAIDAANGKTVTLLKSVETEMVTVQAGHTVVLNTNGMTLTNKNGSYAINNNGTLTINGGGKIVRENAGNSAIRTIGTLTLENVTVEVKPDTMIAVKVDENGVGTKGTLFVKDGTVLNAANGQAIQAWGDVTVSGGTINGEVAAWSVKDWNPGNIAIESGVVNGDVTANQRVKDGNYPDKAASVTIKGGTVTGQVAVAYVEFKNGELSDRSEEKDHFTVDGNISVSGGKFTTADVKQYLASGKQQNADGTVTDKSYYYVPGTTVDAAAASPKTVDTGIALYVGMALTSAAGAVFVGKKRED